MLSPLGHYIRDIRDIRRSGAAVDETSYYGSLANLLNTVGASIKPRVRTVINLKNQGAGLPDGGFFTRDQLTSDLTHKLLKGHVPARGVLEVKGTGEDVDVVVESKQINQYFNKYRQVLVCNLRDFVQVADDGTGRPTAFERFRLAPDEASFWTLPESQFAALSEQFEDYLRRQLVRAAPLTTAADLAWLLAAYARESRARLDEAGTTGLGPLRASLEEIVGNRLHR